MASCDICGKAGPLFRTLIEGSEMQVCEDCSKFGKVIASVKPKQSTKDIIKQEKHEQRRPILPEKEVIQVIVEDYAERVKKGREKLGLKQEDFAKSINERESLIHKIETGIFEPNIDFARKLEKALKITLVEQHEEVRGKSEKAKPDSFTIGDFIKVK